MGHVEVVETRTVIVTADFGSRMLRIAFTPKASRHKRNLAPMVVPFDMITRIEERGGNFTRRYRIIIDGFEAECARPEAHNPAMFYVPFHQDEMRELMFAVDAARNQQPPSTPSPDEPGRDTIDTISLTDNARTMLATWDALHDIQEATGQAHPIDSPTEPRMRGGD